MSPCNPQEFHSDNALKAKPFFQPVGQGKPKYINNQFGGSIGGPIKHNKLFYFASWEGTYERQTGVTFATVPTAAIRSGDMSGSSGLIYDPLTGNPDGSGRAPLCEQAGSTSAPGSACPETRCCHSLAEYLESALEQLLRQRPIRCEPFEAGWQSELDCDGQAECQRPHGLASLHDDRPARVRRQWRPACLSRWRPSRPRF